MSCQTRNHSQGGANVAPASASLSSSFEERAGVRSRLPQGWTSVRVGDVLSLVNGAAFKPTDWRKSGDPIIRIQNLNNPDAPFNHTSKKLPDKFRVRTGDLLFAWSGTPGTSFGTHIWRGGEAWLNQHIFRVEFDPRLFQKEFLRLAINRNLDDYIAQAHGGAGLAHITKGRFEASFILLPPLAEQRRIVARLEALEARSRRTRAALDEVPALLAQARQSLLATAFCGDLTKEWRSVRPEATRPDHQLATLRAERRRMWEETEEARFRRLGRSKPADGWLGKYEEPPLPDSKTLPNLPRTWTWVTLDAALVSLRNGIPIKPDGESGLPILRISAVRPLLLNLSDRRFLRKDSEEYHDYELREHDLLFTRYNGNPELVGVCAVVPRIKERLVYPDKLIRGRAVSSAIEPRFLAGAVNTGASRDFIAARGKTAAGQVGISGSDLKRTPVPFPPLAEQREIVRRLEAALTRLDAAAAAHAAAVAELDLLDQSLLARAFRGELVPQDPNDEPASALLARIQADVTAELPSSAPPPAGVPA